MTDELANLIKEYVDKRLRDILIGCVAMVDRHDTAAMRADVKPMLQFTAAGAATPTAFAMLGGIPVQFLYAGGYYIRPEYTRGDLVWVTFASFDISQGMRGSKDNASGSMFQRESASVAFGLAKSGWTPPAEFSEPGLLIGHKDGTAFMKFAADMVTFQFGPTSSVEVSATGVKWIGPASNVEVSAAGVKWNGPAGAVDLVTHIHPYVDTPAGPSVTSPPQPA